MKNNPILSIEKKIKLNPREESKKCFTHNEVVIIETILLYNFNYKNTFIIIF